MMVSRASTMSRKSAKEETPVLNSGLSVRAIEPLAIGLVDMRSCVVSNSAHSVIFVESGSGTLRVESGEYKVAGGSLCFIGAHQPFETALSHNTRGLMICWSMEYVTLYEKTSSAVTNAIQLNRQISHPVIQLGPEDGLFIAQIGAAMIRELEQELELRQEMSENLLRTVMICVARQLEVSFDGYRSRRADLVNSFYTKLEEHFSTMKSTSRYAKLLNVSPGYLNEIVKQVTGHTVRYHISQRVVLEAKRRALVDGFNLKQIAYDLGFEDPAHFSKYFKNQCGRNFTDFRKSAGSSAA
ncbi:helix-turn-helix transcriptional regulator [Chryseolinea sp. T2]|uniref:AraC family transcriptional regulator n=1 Tax=Chryseolinea sp. T2 TaxID=3129255 RepID=UPI003076C8C6